ncbi:MAG: alkaline phosphatase, partial [Cyanobacteria bacterium J06632_22]
MSLKLTLGALAPAALFLGAISAPADALSLNRLGGAEVEGGAEISAFDPDSDNLFVTTGDTIEIFNLFDPANPTFVSSIDLTDPTNIGGFASGGVNSVAFSNGILAAAIEADDKQAEGIVAFFNAAGVFDKSFVVGALPDMVTFTPDGTKVLVANEGEPDDGIDPDGSVSIIDISGEFESLGQQNVATADFLRFNGREADLRGDGVRIFPDATVAQDVEPEYIAVSPDGTKAFVTLQE